MPSPVGIRQGLCGSQRSLSVAGYPSTKSHELSARGLGRTEALNRVSLGVLWSHELSARGLGRTCLCR